MDNNVVFTKRVFIIGLIKLFIFFVIIIRLFYLQIRESLYFKKLADKNRTSLVPIIPKRGVIYDRFFTKIASHVLTWELLFIKSQINTDINVFLSSFDEIISLSVEEKLRISKDYKKYTPYTPILVKTNLTEKQVAVLETLSYKISGIFIRPIYKRYYPYKYVFSHILGYVGITNDLNKTKNISNWATGKIGLEFSLDSTLRGEVGFLKYEVNAYGKVIKELERQTPIAGYDVSLTIDYKLQNYIFSLLEGFSGSCIVVDVKNGDILSLVSTPSFDANLFVDGIEQSEWNKLLGNEYKPLSNKSALSMYPPGSTIKPIMSLIALDKGVIDPKQTVKCKGYIDVGRHRFHCWKKEGHGVVNMEEAIFNSCDVYFYELAKKLTIADMIKVGKDFGFGETHLPLIKNESLGKTLDMEDEGHLGQKIISIIGQGKWLTTPVQLANMITIIANDGKILPFNLLKSIESKNKIMYPKMKNNVTQLSYKQEHFDIIKEAMFKTINHPKGTGANARISAKHKPFPDWKVAGKTGTSQVKRISLEDRKNGLNVENIPWQFRDHALFVGFLPFHDPKYSVTLVLDHASSSTYITAPISKKIMMEVKKRHLLYDKQDKIINKILETRDY
jgi:penicillin-binding protein 2